MVNATLPRSSGLLFEGVVSSSPGAVHGGQPASPHVAEWDHYVENHPDGTIFHTHAWRRAVEASFGHQPIFLSAQREGKLVGVLPLYQVESRFLGRVLVSVPYGVGGGILADDAESASVLYESATRTAQDRRCVGVDFRSERAVVDDLPVVGGYVGFRKTLPDHVDEVLSSLPRKARAAARRARRGYQLSVSYGDSHLSTVWDLYCRNMRRLGSLNYPYRFFQTLMRETTGSHWVSVVRRGNRPVAGLVTFLFGDTVLPYFVGFSSDARRCHAANFLYLCTMERAVSKGFSQFDLGRSRRENTGSYNFKRFQGFVPRDLGYQYYTVPGNHPVSFSPSQPRYRLARRIWPHLPLYVTRTIGSKLTKHFPG